MPPTTGASAAAPRAAVAEEAMRLALAAAARGRGHTHPNPMVGCVVVNGDRVVGVGHHARAGLAHAEVVALAAAGSAARGGHLVVTLEPCCHTGRTGPCTEAIIAAGITRVTAAMRDPHPAVDGRGLRRLRAAGISVEVGLLGRRARDLNEAWLAATTRGRPFVAAKMAQSLDGRVACHTGLSRWITSPGARRVGHRLRGSHDAIMVGVGTVLADDPRLSCRLAGHRQPLRVIIDSRARTPPSARALRPSAAASPAWVVVGPQAERAARQRLTAAGARVMAMPPGAGGVDLAATLAALGAGGLVSVLVEGGPRLLGSLFDGGLVDRIYTMVAPCIIGGAGAPPAVAGVGAARPTDAWRLVAARPFAAGRDWGVTARVAPARAGTAPPGPPW